MYGTGTPGTIPEAAGTTSSSTYCWGSTVWYVVPAAAEVPAAGMIPAVLVNNMYVIMNITGAISNRN